MSMFCASVRTRRCSRSLRKAAASSSISVFGSSSLMCFPRLCMFHLYVGMRSEIVYVGQVPRRGGVREDSGEAVGEEFSPLALPVRVANEVLADLNQDIGQAPNRRVAEDAVVAQIPLVRLVVANFEPGALAKLPQKRHGQPRVLVPQNRRMPFSWHATPIFGEAVDRHDDRDHAMIEHGSDLFRDGGVIGRKEPGNALLPLRFVNTHIAGDERAV